MRTVIGVDIGRRTIKAAQLVRRGDGYRASALSLLPRPEPQKEICGADAQALRRVLGRQGFRGRRIVIAAPESRVMRAALELPAKVTGGSVEQIVRLELARLHHAAPDSFEVAFWEWRTPDGAKPVTHTLAVGYPHDAADEVLDIFEAEGFEVAALDVRSMAAIRACVPLLLPAPQITAIVDLGWGSTAALFVCGRSLLYERLIDTVCLAEPAGKIAETFGITLEAALQVVNTVGPTGDQPTDGMDQGTFDAIHKCLRAHVDDLLDALQVPVSYVNHQFPGDGVKRVLLIGGGAAVPQFAAYMQERLGIEVKAAAPSDLAQSPRELLAKAGNPVMTVAVGLAQFEGAG